MALVVFYVQSSNVYCSKHVSVIRESDLRYNRNWGIDISIIPRNVKRGKSGSEKSSRRGGVDWYL